MLSFTFQAVLAASVAYATATPDTVNDASKPHVLFIVIDDLGFDDVGFRYDPCSVAFDLMPNVTVWRS